ncbi:ChbG/HpnK family deacetylase [Micromonospora sp. WMMD980]|uniref:ChbG/HpnK family deacetylase n=1 Tax=Micromonospora sp. WMMD980 TaxID=3016088 RepID=UPI0024168609|nr:ChbG/HpnK family deacetylase [Micromonospora sp. WMMD980]MDG4799946.1 ChbG/HpnK family deacetylase [Micromonospora sp. WMMD980]
MSVMVPAPAFDDAVTRFGRMSVVDVGVHLTLTSEWVTPRWRPVLPPHEVPSLVDDEGYLLPDPHDLFARGISVDEAVAEARAQVAVARQAGLEPSYLDEHMGVGWLPTLRDALEALCWASDLIPAERYPYLPDAGEPFATRISGAPSGVHVLVTHPGHDEPELRRVHLRDGRPGEVARQRDDERRELVAAPLARELARPGIEVVRFSTLLA